MCMIIVGLESSIASNLKVYDLFTFGFIHRNGSFLYQMKALIFLITPVKYDMQQMLILKVTSENVGKVHKR